MYIIILLRILFSSRSETTARTKPFSTQERCPRVVGPRGHFYHELINELNWYEYWRGNLESLKKNIVAWSVTLHEKWCWLHKSSSLKTVQLWRSSTNPGYQQRHPLYCKIPPRLAEAHRLPTSLFTPLHPQSNGLAENYVKTVKRAISWMQPSSFPSLDRAFDNFLLQYRNTVHTTEFQWNLTKNDYFLKIFRLVG